MDDRKEREKSVNKELQDLKRKEVLFENKNLWRHANLSPFHAAANDKILEYIHI